VGMRPLFARGHDTSQLSVENGHFSGVARAVLLFALRSPTEPCRGCRFCRRPLRRGRAVGAGIAG